MTRHTRSTPLRSDHPSLTDRRGFLHWGGAAVTGLGVLGCGRQPTNPLTDRDNSSTTSTSQVPLRIVWSGSETSADVLKRNWQSVSEQPLELRVLSPTSGQWVKASQEADAVVYPMMLLPELVNRDLLMPLPADVETQQATQTPAALKVSTTYQGEMRGVALGGQLPSILMNRENAPSAGNIATWQDYTDLIGQSEGKWAEPMAENWAAASFLWRIASSLGTTWLLDRQTLAPIITNDEYVATLEQMATGLKNASQAEMTPGQIWQAVKQGDLIGGIGFPMLNPADSSGEDGSAELVETIVLGLPKNSASGLQRLMLNPFSLVGSIASSCRQSSAAAVFLKWLAGGEGSESLYRNVEELVDLSSTDENATQADEQYRHWLRQQLGRSSVVAPLPLLGSIEYYQVLDDQVRKCVAGQVAAAKACREIADRWQELHQQYGVKKQKLVWRGA